MKFEIKNEILSFLENYGGRNFTEFKELNKEERKEIGNRARDNFIELSNYILKEKLYGYGYSLISTNQWQNSGYFSKYLWSQFKKDGYENLPSSISFFAMKKTDNSLVFRISLEEDGKIAEKDHELHNSFLESIELQNDFKAVIVNEKEMSLENAIKQYKENKTFNKVTIQKELVYANYKEEYKFADLEKLLESVTIFNKYYDVITQNAKIVHKNQGDKNMIKDELVQNLSEKLIESKNIILRGAPGTGKSYLAKEIAAQLIGVSKDSLENSDRFEFVQFHPSYDYTDFVEGLRPVVSEDGTMGFELQSGVFKSFCTSAINAQKYGGQDNFEESYDSYLDYINSSDEKEYLTRSCFVSINSKNNLKVSYDSGAEGGVIPKLYLYELYKDENYNEQNYYRSNGLTVLERLKEKFGLLDYDKPNLNKKDVTKKFVFVIDEINRGEISKIFGELFYSIDPGYRGQLGAVKTQYSNMSSSNEKFYIPENVYIIGTMNDIDRSVDSFDFAMRRRFRFIEIKANESTDMLNGLENKEEAIVKMVCLNNAISEVEELNDNYHIGASYFLKLDSLTFEELWCDYLEPLLADYIRGMFNEEEIMKSFKKAYNSNFSKIGDMNDDSQNQG